MHVISKPYQTFCIFPTIKNWNAWHLGIWWSSLISNSSQSQNLRWKGLQMDKSSYGHCISYSIQFCPKKDQKGTCTNPCAWWIPRASSLEPSWPHDGCSWNVSLWRVWIGITLSQKKLRTKRSLTEKCGIVSGHMTWLHCRHQFPACLVPVVPRVPLTRI